MTTQRIVFVVIVAIYVISLILTLIVHAGEGYSRVLVCLPVTHSNFGDY